MHLIQICEVLKQNNVVIAPHRDAWRKATGDSVFSRAAVIAEDIQQSASVIVLPIVPKCTVEKSKISNDS